VEKDVVVDVVVSEAVAAVTDLVAVVAPVDARVRTGTPRPSSDVS